MYKGSLAFLSSLNPSANKPISFLPSFLLYAFLMDSRTTPGTTTAGARIAPQGICLTDSFLMCSFICNNTCHSCNHSRNHSNQNTFCFSLMLPGFIPCPQNTNRFQLLHLFFISFSVNNNVCNMLHNYFIVFYILTT